jgi:hypothetical protein
MTKLELAKCKKNHLISQQQTQGTLIHQSQIQYAALC